MRSRLNLAPSHKTNIDGSQKEPTMNLINRAVGLCPTTHAAQTGTLRVVSIGCWTPRRAGGVCQRELSMKSFAPTNQRRTTMSRKTTLLNTGLFAIAIVSSSFANAQDQNNPLHPSYYVGMTASVAISTGGEERYVDARDPLHPAYARGSASDAWQASGARSMQAHVDHHNPLHPSFKR
jgi:hypothetical protein